jgi:transcriptional regulator NrdR family protein
MEVVKRRGHKEGFDEKKLYGSVYSACASLRMTEEQAELLATIVTHEVKQVFHQQAEVDSKQILKAAAEVLHRLNPDAAYIYETHRDIN